MSHELTNLSLFSGAGGLDLAAKWTGKIKTVAYVENDPYAQGVLLSHMRNGQLDDAPIFEDVRTFRGASLRGSIDIVSGGFPCQDLSVAGKRAGITGSRSGLWVEFARIIGEVGPRFVLVENVPGLVFSGGIGALLGALAEMGYDAGWYTLSAAAVGAPHLRERVWIVAYAGRNGGESQRGFGQMENEEGEVTPSKEKWERDGDAIGSGGSSLADSRVKRFQRSRNFPRILETTANSSAKPQRRSEMANPAIVERTARPQKYGTFGSMPQDGRKPDNPDRSSWWSTESSIRRVAHGVAFRVDRLRCIGNGVVPQQALPAWEKIIEMSHELWR